MMFLCTSRQVHAETYTDGAIVVKHEITVKERPPRAIQSPHELTGNCIANALSYIHFEEKGPLKRKVHCGLQDDEIRKLVPLIVQAFSVATPAQVVAVSSILNVCF
ncbi:MAG: hypothetical protein HS132_02700 [Planctomycetia bacterium]|nr:hypothetical protein [Planctomycetia bacterium]